MLFTKWLLSHWNWTAISSRLPMSLVWAFTQTQCLTADSKRRAWIFPYHIKIVRFSAAVNHSQAPAYLSGTRPNCSKCISIDTERHMKTGFMLAANWGEKRERGSLMSSKHPLNKGICLKSRLCASQLPSEREEKGAKRSSVIFPEQRSSW